MLKLSNYKSIEKLKADIRVEICVYSFKSLLLAATRWSFF